MNSILVVIIGMFWFLLVGIAASGGGAGGARDLSTPRMKPPKPRTKTQKSKSDCVVEEKTNSKEEE